MMQKKHIAAVFTGVGCLMLIVHVHAIGALGSAVAVYVVNSADDSRHDGCDQAHCNLREAIEAANQSPGAHIRFQLPEAPYRIAVLSELPPLLGGIVLDGASQTGTACPIPVVQLDGSEIKAAGVNGLVVAGDRNTVRGLVISQFSGHGVVVRGDENTLQCLFVGTDATGMHGAGNGGHGIDVEVGRSNLIGGRVREEGNLLSGNVGMGLRLRDAIGTLEQFNYIGVNILERPTLPNGNVDPEADLPPPPGSGLPPAEAAQLAERIAATMRGLGPHYQNVLARSGIMGRYRALVAPNVLAQQTSLLDVMRLLAPHPELLAAFTTEISTQIARDRERVALQLDVLQTHFPNADTFLRARRPFGPPNRLAELVAVADPDDIALSGPPSTVLALRTADPPQFQLTPFRFSYLSAVGPTSFGAEILEDVEAACPDIAPCEWPFVYDLRPIGIDLVWETEFFTEQEVTAMVEENDYFLSVYLNGGMLLKGPMGSLTGPIGPDYWALRLPTDECPSFNPCIALQVGVRDRIPNVPLPWTFELRIERLDDLHVPVIGGFDENGNPILITQQAVVINRSFKTFNPNPTNDRSWFVEAMEPTFRSDRCVQCHRFGTIEAVEAHHAVIGGTFGDAQLTPSLFVPGAHVITCSNCHFMPMTDDLGRLFHEIDWRVPYVDLDVDWSTKTAQQICGRVKANLPTNSLRSQHFHGDARLFWAVEYFNGIDPLPKATPMDYEEFLRRFDLWNLGGTPCP